MGKLKATVFGRSRFSGIRKKIRDQGDHHRLQFCKLVKFRSCSVRVESVLLGPLAESARAAIRPIYLQ